MKDIGSRTQCRVSIMIAEAMRVKLVRVQEPRADAIRPPLSGVVVCLNEADRIARCVTTLRQVCAEVLVLDSGSDDATVAIARAAGAEVEHQEWLGFATQKNSVIGRARHPWVLLLDADEWLAPSAPERIRSLFASGEIERADVWLLPRRTRFLGRTLQFGGAGNAWLPRLFRADSRYLLARSGERLDLRGKRCRRIKARIDHDTARSLSEYRGKLDRYATLFARQKHSLGHAADGVDPILHAVAYWLKNYLLRGGFLDGRAGFRYHASFARYVYDKYARLRQLSQDHSG